MIRNRTTRPYLIMGLLFCITFFSLFEHVLSVMCWSNGKDSTPCKPRRDDGCYLWSTNIDYQAGTFGIVKENTGCTENSKVQEGEKRCEFPDDEKSKTADCFCGGDNCNDVSNGWEEFIKDEYKKHYGITDPPPTEPETEKKSMITGANIAIIAIVSVIVVAAIGAVVFVLFCRKKPTPASKREEAKAAGGEVANESKSQTQEVVTARLTPDYFIPVIPMTEASKIKDAVRGITGVTAKTYCISYNGLFQKRKLPISTAPQFTQTGHANNLVLTSAPDEARSAEFFVKSVELKVKAIVMAMDVAGLKGDIYFPYSNKKSATPKPLSYVDGKSEITVRSSPRIPIGECEKSALEVEVNGAKSNIAHYEIKMWKAAYSFGDSASKAIDDIVMCLGDAIREAGIGNIIVHCLDGTNATAAVAVAIDIVRRVLAGESVDPVKVAEMIVKDRPSAIASQAEFLLAIVLALKIMEKMAGEVPANVKNSITEFEQSCKILAREAMEKQATRKVAIAETWSSDGETADSGRPVEKKNRKQTKSKSKDSKPKRGMTPNKTKSKSKSKSSQKSKVADSIDGTQPSGSAPA